VRPAGAEPSLGELLTRLTTDTGDLVRQEVALVRAEVRQVGSTLARDGTRLGIALGLALAGALAVTAFLVIAIGDLLNNYWLGALVVGLVLLAVGAVLARSAIADVKRRGLTPQQSVASLKEDAAWAKQESREVKRELTR
jgi:xanthine/uracil permease